MNKQVTMNEYKKLVNEYWNGNITMKQLDEYEIILEIQPSHENEFINNLVIKFCDDHRQEENRIIYLGSLGQYKLYNNIDELRKNGFKYVSDWSDSYREVFINENDNVIVTTCEGDLSISIMNDNNAYENEIERCIEFYNEY